MTATPPSFERLFGRVPEISAQAPGRVNLIGEHTDYNGGCVLPMAIPQCTRVEIARRRDKQVHLYSTHASGEQVTFDLGQERRRTAWFDYVQGLTQVLREHNVELPGFDARIESTVPIGSGLSSSASLLVAMARALRKLLGLQLADVQLALLAHSAEQNFVGVPVGVMDPFAASLADTQTALFLNTQTLAFERIHLPDEVELLVIDSGVAHEHAGGHYRVRRRECQEAAAALGVALLCDLDVAALPKVEQLIPTLARRARHVITENARVHSAIAAIRARDVARLGRLFDESHASMRDDFEVSVPAVDELVELTRSRPGVYGARLTGGGFGGAIVALVERGGSAAAGAAVVELYGRKLGRQARVLVEGKMS